MRSKRLAATAAAGLALLTTVAFSGTTSAQELSSSIVVELEVIGDGPSGPYQLVIACEPLLEENGPAATIDIPFELSAGELAVFTDEELGVDFSAGANCSLGQEVKEGQLGVGMAVVAEDDILVADADFGPDVEMAIIEWETALDYDGIYGVGVVNAFAETPPSTTSTTAAPAPAPSTTAAPAARPAQVTPRFAG